MRGGVRRDHSKSKQKQYIRTIQTISMKKNVWLYGCLALLLISDVITTTVALSLGAIEGNPLMEYIVHNPIQHFMIKMMFLGVVWFMANRTLQFHPKGDVAVIGSCVIFYTLPFMNNLYQIVG